MKKSNNKMNSCRIERSLGFLFWQTNNMWERKINCKLKELNLTHVQFVLLAGISWFNLNNEYINQATLSRHSNTNIMMTSKVLRTLEKKGLINRKQDKVDTRQYHLFITDKGKDKLDKGFPIVRRVTEVFFSSVEDKKEELINILKTTLESNLEKENHIEK